MGDALMQASKRLGSELPDHKLWKSGGPVKFLMVHNLQMHLDVNSLCKTKHS